MKKIGTKIVEEGLIIEGPIKERKTVRGIMFDPECQVLMVYSELFDDYTFPGGGTKHHEDQISTLKRELKEEIGADTVSDITPYGFTEEIRYGIKGSDDIFLQTSYYYLCKVNQLGKQSLIDREKLHGLIPKWVNIDFAIQMNQRVKNNHMHQQKGLKTVLIRELMVLNDIKENLICENLKSSTNS
jgi:8-oxo-dGTP pyrophosphatase MutT (NUDIX family)